MINLAQVARVIDVNSPFRWEKVNDSHIFSDGCWIVKTSKSHPKSLSNKLNRIFGGKSPDNMETLFRGITGNKTRDIDRKLSNKIEEIYLSSNKVITQTNLIETGQPTEVAIFKTNDSYIYVNNDFCNIVRDISSREIGCSGVYEPIIIGDSIEVVIIMPIRKTSDNIHLKCIGEDKNHGNNTAK